MQPDEIEEMKSLAIKATEGETLSLEEESRLLEFINKDLSQLNEDLEVILLQEKLKALNNT